MQAYISISFSKRKELEKEVQAIKNALQKCGISGFVFVDEYQFSAKQEKKMMQNAIEDIEKSAILIAETSEKGIGIGIEVGYAKAKNIPVIYMRNSKSEHSTTVSGIADFSIIYSDEKDLEEKLEEILKNNFSKT
jgi:nucleoside 2-deoxyribosyltransferase